MKQSLLVWPRMLVTIPEGPKRRLALVRRAVLFLGMILLLTEAAVAVRFSGSAGLMLMVTTAGLGAFVYRGIGALNSSTPDNADVMAAFFDESTGLPGRQQLIDTLSRDIARSERYAHALTLSIVHIAQYEHLKASWGDATAQLAVGHVVETLRRITRASDLLCRLDESTFAVVLLQCNERQAGLFGDRLALAVGNRPLKSASKAKVPLYVGVDTNAVEYDAIRFRGPLDFLSFAGGDVVAPLLSQSRRSNLARKGAMIDAQELREQAAIDYYPGGQMKDFADAYREARNRNRHAG
ncbi:MAG: diguanylate cyclase [Tepidiformaceae bacterium]